MLEYLKNRPKWLNSYSYLTVMGSRAYGTETETSDWDFYGFCVPPIEIVFPHTKGEILGFGRNIQHFEQFEAQHVEHPGYGEFDITIYNIVKYFQLLMEGNPNLVDSIFTDDNSVLYMDNIGRIVKEHRHLFLSQKCYHTFKGMMWSHLSRLKTGHIKEGRKELGEKYGYDTKDAYHSTRMIFQLRNILFHADMNLRSNKDVLLAVRCGQITKDEVISFCEEQLVEFEKAKEHFVVRYAPDEDKIRRVLVDCLEESYGNLRKIGYNFA